MGLLRSETMVQGTLVLPIARARHFVNLIGGRANIQFEDMHAHEQVPARAYKKYIQRIDEVERQLRFVTEEVETLPVAQEIVKQRVDSFLERAADYELDAVERHVGEVYRHFLALKTNNEELVVKRNEAIEERHVAECALRAFYSSPSGRGVESFEQSASQSLLERGGQAAFSNVAGTIAKSDQERFERFLFRSTRGNSYTCFIDLDAPMTDPKTGADILKTVFVVFYQDVRGVSGGSAMQQKVLRACQAFGVNLYHWPDTMEEAKQRAQDLQVLSQEKMQAVDAYQRYVAEEAAELIRLAAAGGNSRMEEYRMFCLREKAIFATLNLFEGDDTLRATCWFPEEEEPSIRSLLADEDEASGGNAFLVNNAGRVKNAPTYFKENDCLAAVQEVIHTYGMPRYKEASPVLLSLVTFPMIFGAMFGDVGHGALLFCVGLYLLTKKDLQFTSPMAYKFRYLVCMMGFFAMFMGLMYNDIFSIGLEHCESRFQPPKSKLPLVAGASTVEYEFKPWFNAKNEAGTDKEGPCVMGIDPAWHGATNELLFLNSLKMKISVIVGVLHMTAGLVLRVSNTIYEGNMVDLFCECIPMLIFMVCFFGWMDFCILYKWVHAQYPHAPPSVINTLIAMMMGQDNPDALYHGSIELQGKLVLLIGLSVPWLLLPKPIILTMKQNRAAQREHLPLHDEDEEEEHHDASEIWIHQVIETIEYVLGTVSHCASYLRIWALSLAHQQLSLVFFNMALAGSLASTSPLAPVLIYLGFGAWFAITVAVLMGMDVMECFLHTLRLHWIEYMSKHARSDGHAFAPFRHFLSICPKAD